MKRKREEEPCQEQGEKRKKQEEAPCLESKFLNLFESKDLDGAKKTFNEIVKKNNKKKSSMSFILESQFLNNAGKLTILNWIINKDGFNHNLLQVDFDWKIIFKQDRELIEFFANLNSFDVIKYSANKNFYKSFIFDEKAECNCEEKILQLIEIFNDKKIDWIRIFCIYLYINSFSCEILKKLYEKILPEKKSINFGIKFSIKEMFNISAFYCKDSELKATYVTPLVLAIFSKNLSKVKYLIEEYGADLNIYLKAPEGLSLNNADKGWLSLSPLHFACLNSGCRDIANYLVKKGAIIDAVDSLNRTPLCMAFSFDNFDCGYDLIKKGANINIIDKNKFLSYYFLAFAELERLDKEYFDIFKSRGLSAVGKDGKNLLHILCLSEKIRFFRFFADFRNLLNIQDMNGDSPLHIACKNKFFDKALVLVERGADLKLKDKYGKTPIDILCEFDEINFGLMCEIASKGDIDKETKTIIIQDAIKKSENPAIKDFYKMLMCDKKYYKKPDFDQDSGLNQDTNSGNLSYFL